MQQAMPDKIASFENKKIRSVWAGAEEGWYFPVVDAVGALTDSSSPHKCWSVLKGRLKAKGSELTTKCSQLEAQGVCGFLIPAFHCPF